MAGRTIYDVGPQDGGWYVKRRGAVRASAVKQTKQEAIELGVSLARANQPSQLVIRRANGTIEDERTYGSDPFPPPG